MAQNLQWYWKRDGKVKGPFATGLIQKYIILGRVHPDDLMSQDKQTWRRAATIRALIPEVYKHRNDENFAERLKAAKRWAEDRTEIRADMEDTIPRHHNTRLRIKTLGWKSILLWLLLMTVLLAAFFVFMPKQQKVVVDCSLKLEAGGVFDNCVFKKNAPRSRDLTKISMKNAIMRGMNLSDTRLSHAQLHYSQMQGVNLSNARLDHAQLYGANLKGAILLNTDFSHADLSYADLSKARVKNINLKQARLSKTIWFNGQVCANGSLGRCLVEVKKKDQ